MMQKKSVMIGVVLVVAIALAAVVKKSRSQKEKMESSERVTTLYQEVEPLKAEWAELYQKRQELMISWAKSTNTKLAPNLLSAPKNELKTEQDFKDYDQYQMQITNQLVALLANPDLKKRSKELEKIEEQINRKRNAYHAASFEADDLIKKYGTGQTPIPVFPAEQSLHK